VVLPGIQALFGFQLIAVFNERFRQLSEGEQLDRNRAHYDPCGLSSLGGAGDRVDFLRQAGVMANRRGYGAGDDWPHARGLLASSAHTGQCKNKPCSCHFSASDLFNALVRVSFIHAPLPFAGLVNAQPHRSQSLW
jgi:hypothetical protein